mmetsp:Transcript_4540/g.12714  ORF Transcript_4540/g.12714 Transcript_4540/m.12714 type:complete len:296 (-) Transcript_4540:770-1657(-)
MDDIKFVFFFLLYLVTCLLYSNGALCFLPVIPQQLLRFLQLTFNFVAATGALIILIDTVQLVRNGGGGDDPFEAWCPPLLSTPLPRSLETVYYWDHILRWFFVVETALVIFSRKPLRALHVFHHASMILTAFLWLRLRLRVGIGLLILNMLDITLTYFGYFFSDCRIPFPRKLLTSYYAQIETAIGYFNAGVYLYSHFTTPRKCGEFQFVLIIAFFHIAVGHWLNSHRNSESTFPAMSGSAPVSRTLSRFFLWALVMATLALLHTTTPGVDMATSCLTGVLMGAIYCFTDYLYVR